MTNTILITGASSGIGRAAAKRFQSAGWNVVATMRSPEREQELNTLERVLVTRLDVLDLASIDAAVTESHARFGHIDVLLNNAGYGAYGPLEATSIDKVRRQFDVNVIGVLATTKALLPYFRKQRSGTIINISSIGGKMTFPLGSLYHGTKFAVEGLSESLHFELLPLGVRVKIVEPGMVQIACVMKPAQTQNISWLLGAPLTMPPSLAVYDHSLACELSKVVTGNYHSNPLTAEDGLRPFRREETIMTITNQGIALSDAIQIYFQGEKIEALVFILPIGLLSLVFGAWLLSDNPSSFGKGVAIPFLLMGLLMSTVGGVVGFRTPSQASGIVRAMEVNPQAGVQAEIDRMTKVNNAWHLYLVMWGLFGAAGLLMRFATSSDFLRGMGIALVFIAGVGLLVDGFAERRTHPYVDALQGSTLTPEAQK